MRHFRIHAAAFLALIAALALGTANAAAAAAADVGVDVGAKPKTDAHAKDWVWWEGESPAKTNLNNGGFPASQYASTAMA